MEIKDIKEIILKVSLNQNEDFPRLEVNEKYHPNHIPRACDVQIIRWKLIDHAGHGSFNSQTEPEPGFAWLPTKPTPGIFGEPTPEHSHTELTMCDFNTSDGAIGEWTYQLSATIDGKVYQTVPYPSPARTRTR